MPSTIRNPLVWIFEEFERIPDVAPHRLVKLG